MMKNRTWTMSIALLAAPALLLAACGDDDSASGEAAVEDSTRDAIESELGEGCGFLGELALSGFDASLEPTEDLTDPDAGSSYELLSEQMAEVADAAPDEIADAFETMADGFRSYADAFEDIDFSDPSSIDPSAFEGIEDAMGEGFQEASDEIDAWMTENCSG